MRIEKIIYNGVTTAIIAEDGVVLKDTQSALDLLMSAKYEAGTKKSLSARS